jgi:hypothetical protein
MVSLVGLGNQNRGKSVVVVLGPLSYANDQLNFLSLAPVLISLFIASFFESCTYFLGVVFGG